jgi:hypothetical protein
MPSGRWRKQLDQLVKTDCGIALVQFGVAE